ncbi:MAG: aldose epimerase family protein [Bacteroidota bacterium]
MELPKIIRISNRNKVTLAISTIGATIVSLEVPNYQGQPTNVVVGLSKAEDYVEDLYLKEGLYLGATIGRHAGRVSKKHITIERKIFPIHHTNGVHLHGGKEGFDKKLWKVEAITMGSSPSVTLSYVSNHLEEGYLGTLKVFVTYTLTEENALKIQYKATTDQTTIVNLTNHSYFNLDGEGSILNHQLEIHSDSYLDLDKQLIPTGKINSVSGTQFDYTNTTSVGRTGFKGLDDIFVLNENDPKVILSSKKSGIQMKVFTNQPAVVVYTPPKFAALPFKNNAIYSDFPAICFETQKYPDAIHNDHFPSVLLKPNETYNNETIFLFSNIRKSI